ncbi:MAG: hypothetical protein V3S14_07335, partial [Anaerolineae bacterium]
MNTSSATITFRSGGGITPQQLYGWCKMPDGELENHPRLKIPFRLCKDSAEMGHLIARELVDEIKAQNAKGDTTRAESVAQAGHETSFL